jgi:hypothetical protein
MILYNDDLIILIDEHILNRDELMVRKITGSVIFGTDSQS